jgi:Carboxypeptidase regulatory-like domain/TonB-dependent Receptor Plug Domain
MRHLRVRELIVAGGIGVLIAVLVPLAGAQDISKGSIIGVVRDATSAVVADADVTLSSAFGEKKTKTNGVGEYVFLNLTPGSDYSVTVQKQGFSLEKVPALTVSLNQRTTANVTLQVGATAQTVEVVAVATATVDMASTGVGANLNESLYKSVAAGRNISSIINFAPGVTSSQGAGFANPSINGASGLENEYIINGSDVTDSGYGGFGTYSPIFGALGNGVNFDFIQEVQVKTGGFEAQYGQALGGVVNVITKSGTNNLHGSLYGYFAPQQFEATRPNPNPALVNKSDYREHQGTYDFGADIGGAIKKDKLFFYGGINPTFARNYDIADPSFANYALGTQVLKIFTPNYTGKLNWNIGSKHTLEGTVFGDPSTTNAQYWRGGGPDSQPLGRPTDNLAVSALDYGSRTWSGRYTSTLTPSWIVTANYTDHYNHLTESPLHNGFRITDNTLALSGTGGTITYGGLGLLQNTTSPNHLFSVSSSHIFTLGGSHSLDYGFQFEDQPYTDFYAYSGPSFTLPSDPAFDVAAGKTQFGASVTRTYAIGNTVQKTATGTTVYRMTRGNYSDPNIDVGSRYDSGFIQDAWTIGRHLTLKPGLRFEQQSMHGATGGLSYVFAHNWAPRLGVIYDPTGQRKSKFFANWGRFYEKIPVDIAIRSFSFETSAIGAFYKDSGLGNAPDLSPANWCGAATHPCGTGVGGGNISFQGSPADQEIVYGGTAAEYQDEVVAGFEKEFHNNFTFSGRFVYRHMMRIIEDISGVNSTQANAGVPQQYVVANPSASLDIFHNFTPCTSGPNCDLASGYNDLNQPILGSDGISDGFPNPSRIYKSMELVVGRRFSNGLQFYGSYVLSKLYGNFQGSFRGDNAQTDPNISSLFDFTNSDGLLSGQFIPGVLPTHRTNQFKFFGSYTWKSVNFGVSWQIISGNPITRLLDHPVYLNQGEVPTCADGTFNCSPRGAFGRMPWQYPLDFHADYTHKVTEKVNVKFLADMFNLFNTTFAQYVTQAAEIADQPGTPNPDFLKPGGVTLGQTRDAYTRPFNARLGVRFEF